MRYGRLVSVRRSVKSHYDAIKLFTKERVGKIREGGGGECVSEAAARFGARRSRAFDIEPGATRQIDIKLEERAVNCSV